MSVTLEPYHFGAYQILSDPAGAHVTLHEDNSYAGETPTEVFSFYRLTKDPVLIKYVVEKSGYERVEKELKIIPEFRDEKEARAKPKKLHVTLQKMETDRSATSKLSVTTDPAGASVYGNDEYWGTTPFDKTVEWSNRDSKIELRIEKSGFQTESRMLTSDKRKINIVLQPN